MQIVEPSPDVEFLEALGAGEAPHDRAGERQRIFVEGAL